MTYQRPTISASRLKTMGGEKGKPGCERKTAAQYLFGLKQAETDALRKGSELHLLAQIYQETGVLLEPESEMARRLAAGIHLLNQCGHLLVEYEHVGTLPDGSPYVAYLDGHGRDGHATGTVILQDLKTTGNARYALKGMDPALVEDIPPEERALFGYQDQSEYSLYRDIQVMFYAWILLCDPHWFAPPLPEVHYGPKHWQWWDPKERNAKMCRPRWLYFRTQGNPHAWEETCWVMPEQAQKYMNDVILPLVEKINALHRWHHDNPNATLDQLDRNSAACNGEGRWCGAGERDACNFEELGTPILDLIQLRVRKMTTPQERLAALRNRNAGTAAATAAAPPPPPPPAPEPEPEPEPAPVPAAPEPEPEPAPVPAAPEPEPTPAATAASGELSRGQKAAATRAANKAKSALPTETPATAAGKAGVNPPEVKEALAKASAEVTAPANSAAVKPGVVAPKPSDAVTVPVAVVTLVGVEEIARFLVSQGYAVSKGGVQ